VTPSAACTFAAKRQRAAGDRDLAKPVNGVCVVTGANGGLGKATCLELARRGALVVMVCRDRRRGEAARDEVARSSGSTKVSLVQADLAPLKDVQRLANDLVNRHPEIHALIHTASVYTAARRVTVDGLDAMFAQTTSLSTCSHACCCRRSNAERRPAW
jgi:NAD(P)-dependent dehydrogenase (short-subunit alcohol dehydrogenase family)